MDDNKYSDNAVARTLGIRSSLMLLCSVCTYYAHMVELFWCLIPFWVYPIVDDAFWNHSIRNDYTLQNNMSDCMDSKEEDNDN